MSQALAQDLISSAVFCESSCIRPLILEPSGAVSSTSFTFFNLEKDLYGERVVWQDDLLNEDTHHVFHLRIKGKNTFIVFSSLRSG